MADDDYDLDVLLQMREDERDEAERAYAEAVSERQQLKERLDELESRHREMVERREQKRTHFDEQIADGEITAAKMRKFDQFLVGLRDREREILEQMETVKEKSARADRRIEECRGAMREAVRRLKAVETHYEEWKQQQKVVEKRRRSEKMDDIAARLWREQNR